VLDKKTIALLSLGSLQEIEVLTELNNDDIGSHISTFLNSDGGVIVCEIDIKSYNAEHIRNLTDITEASLQRSIQPSVLFSIEIHYKNSTAYVVIEVPAGIDKPYAYNDDVFVRESKLTQKADIERIRDMVLMRQIEPERWERRLSSNVMEEDISKTEMKSLLSEKRIPLEIRNVESDIFQQLQLLSLAKYNKLTNAGDILMTKTPYNRHPQLRVRAVAYQDKSDDNYQDFRNFEGPLIEVLESVLLFIQQNTPIKVSFYEESNSRKETYIYPLKAIREGVVNAFAHRDYSNSSGGILVEISKNELKIWNSGSFPKGLDEEKLKRGHISILRNPDISHILYIRNYMERLGRGSVVIQDACKESGLPEPKWTSDVDLGVTLTFFAPTSKNAKLDLKNLSLTLNIDFKVLKLLSIIEGEESRPEIQNKLQLKDNDTVRNKYINPALDLELIERTIPDKKTSNKQKYRLAEKGLNIKNQMLLMSSR
jgi:ATP-dependent DNA helicase RecG